ncbi:MAG: hypothetical protein DMF61_12920 [Blastocatellia bacterium AA13]|nr:MAG: hypothetical protein DMF61_12920 [Blastocatellia bacterium AA13]
MASFRDPVKTFAPMEVLERLLEIAEYYGHRPVLYITSSEDLASYLDSFGFDIYSLTSNPAAAFNHTSRIVTVLPNGSRSHESATTH